MIMNVDVYSLDGASKEKLELPAVFSSEYRKDLITRALLSEQSEKHQPQGHSVMAGLQTTAVYVGKYSGYRRGRHMGIAIRPRQKLGGGAMGDVRRIPSSVKGKRAHPHMIEKTIIERMNNKEYSKAVGSAIAGCMLSDIIKKTHPVQKDLPIVVDDAIEKVQKTKELLKVLKALGFSTDLKLSHTPKSTKGRSSRRRHFRKSVLIVTDDSSKISKAGRNIAGVDVVDIKNLDIETLAPGANPRPTIWSKSAVSKVEAALKAG